MYHQPLQLIPETLRFNPQDAYPRGDWYSRSEIRPFIPPIWRMGPTEGPVANRAAHYENVLGYRQRLTPITSNWMPGLGGILDDASALISGAEAKAQKLEQALKIIMALSGVAAATGLINLIRR